VGTEIRSSTLSFVGGAAGLVLVAALALGETGATAAGGLSDYRLLVLNGQRAKWGTPILGTGAALSYAVASTPIHTDGAINCADIAPLDGLFRANRIDRAAFDREIDAAFAAWSAVANISFRRVVDPAQADIVIGAGSEGRGRAFTNVATLTPSVQSAPAAAQASYSAVGGPGVIGRSLICLNPEQPWKIGFDGNLEVYDIRYALMHEIGHAIGLDHPDAPNTLMDFQYTEAFSTMQPGDIAGAAALYGTRTAITRAAVASASGGPALSANR
jgi:hypothetical protein